MVIALCLLAGLAALLGMSSVALALLPTMGLGLAGLVVALGFGAVSLGAGLGAAVLAFGQERRA
ncbi:hypothetical protein [Falsiroseomonas selenitidurans]|uniref:Major facilitator superfamily (MFS) profile domain-containing protein n=1 Tax=Falsiroseomonas selenitidurans TaxID=2716335 RepID=A0ABX1E670_9PROT|nr:hypothetical protein [Falsiroseomonas selenitidurans]NKC32278.1 hypothetical protein [Falsiroseomonas selenitidurans]